MNISSRRLRLRNPALIFGQAMLLARWPHAPEQVDFAAGRVLILVLVCALSAASSSAAEKAIRVATYNTSLYREHDGELIRDLENGDNQQAKKIAEVIQRVRPDVILLNEFDYDADGRAAELFVGKYLGVGQNGCDPIEFAHHFTAPVNTGRPSGRDLDKNGQPGGPADAIGYGTHEGEYGMLVLSSFPIDRERIRTFQKFLWRYMPDAMLPVDPRTGEPFYDQEDLAVLRLSSKSHWDVPIEIPTAEGQDGLTLHLLCSHPTPPVFDGREDRNGHRNHDEIRMLADYLDAERSAYLVDDAGKRGPLAADESFVILGDLNCDPVDGQGVPGTMDLLLNHPRVNGQFVPTSSGGPLVVKKFADQNADRRGKPDRVTGDFTHEGFGNLRIDYALPSKDLSVHDGGIYWPAPDEVGAAAIRATDHRLVWIDVEL